MSLELQLRSLTERISSEFNNKSNINHTHDSRYYTKLDSDNIFDTKSDVGHIHSISQVTGLQSALDSKAPVSHSHTSSQISDSSVIGRDLLSSESALDARTIIGAGTSSLVIGTSAGTAAAGNDSRIVNAVPKTRTVNGKALSSNISINYTDVGASPTSHTHAISDVTGLQLSLDEKASAVHTHAISDVSGLSSELSSKADVGHTHSIANVNGLSTALSGKSDTSHTHTVANITDISEGVQDIVAASLTGGNNVTIQYNDTTGDIVISASMPPVETDQEAVRDVIGGALVAGSGVSIVHNDSLDTITISSTAVLPSRSINAGTGLTGGGSLASDRTISVDFAASGVSSSTKAVRADDSRLSNSRTPTAHSHSISQVTGLQTALDGKSSSSHTHSSSEITDSTVTGRSVLTASSQLEARNAIGAGTSNLSIGSTSTTAAPGNHTHSQYALTSHSHTSSEISDSTAIGRSLITATSTANARSAIGAGTSNLTLGTTAGTAAAGNDSRIVNAVPSSRTVNGLALSSNITLGYADVGAAPSSHNHSISNVSGLQSALDGKANSSHSHSISNVSGLQSALDSKVPFNQDIKTVSGTSYTVVSADNGAAVLCTSASAVSVTVPTGAIPVGGKVDFIQKGEGSITFVAGSGMQVNGTPTLVTRSQWSVVSVLFTSSSEAVVIGDLAA